MRGLVFRDPGSGFRVEVFGLITTSTSDRTDTRCVTRCVGVECRVWILGFQIRVKGSGSGVEDLWLGVQGLACRV